MRYRELKSQRWSYMGERTRVLVTLHIETVA